MQATTSPIPRGLPTKNYSHIDPFHNPNNGLLEYLASDEPVKHWDALEDQGQIDIVETQHQEDA